MTDAQALARERIRGIPDAIAERLGLTEDDAAGILDQPLNHDEVLETGQRVKATFAKLVTAILGRLAGPQSGGGPPDD